MNVVGAVGIPGVVLARMLVKRGNVKPSWI